MEVKSRTMAVLRAVIEEYVETCAPVGSKAVVAHGGLGVSSATVRNDLSRLEESGHLRQPHVSSGRIPTDLGYRTIVDTDLAAGSFSPLSLPVIRATTLKEALSELTSALAVMTSCLAIVSEPSSEAAKVARITLVRTSSGSAVLVVVCDDGRVESRMVRCPNSTQDDIARAEELLSRLFVGVDIDEAQELARRLETTADGLVGRICSLVRASMARPSPAQRTSSGVSLLLAQPEFDDPVRVRVVANALEEELDFSLFGAPGEDGLIVSIGGENADMRLAGVSVVAKEYVAPTGVGLVACIGPTRMDYMRVIGAVKSGASRLEDIFGVLG